MAKDKPLTRTQRYDLEALTRPDSFQSGYGCTNRTMMALEKRGFVKFCWGKKVVGGHWEINDAGRATLVT